MAKKERTALEVMVTMLGRRAYTKAELRRKLFDKGVYPASDIMAAVDYLEKKGFISDEAYAESLTENLSSRGCGPAKIRSKLFMHGVGKDLIDAAIAGNETLSDSSLVKASAVKALEAKKNVLDRCTDGMKRKAKALRFLAGRGFSSDTAFKAYEVFTGSRQSGAEDAEED